MSSSNLVLYVSSSRHHRTRPSPRTVQHLIVLILSTIQRSIRHSLLQTGGHISNSVLNILPVHGGLRGLCLSCTLVYCCLSIYTLYNFCFIPVQSLDVRFFFLFLRRVVSVSVPNILLYLLSSIAASSYSGHLHASLHHSPDSRTG